MLKVEIDNRNGTMWDLSQIVTSVTWKTSIVGTPSSIDLTIIKGGRYQDKSFAINPGDVLRIRRDNYNLFWGYVFEVSSGPDEDVKVKAYDQLRYLLTNDTYVFKNATATDVVKKITADFNLRTGTLEDTGYQMNLVEDGKKLLDIIYGAIDQTLIRTGKRFIMYDDFGNIVLKNTDNLKVDFLIGDKSLMVDYDYTRSIDETYNQIKLVQDNKNTKKRDVYIVKDSANIAKWGLLQLYQKVDDGLNTAQINEMLQALSDTKNREMKKFRIDALGDVRIRAGNYVRVTVEQLGIDQYPFLVDECTHKFDEGDHTMTLELRVI